METMAADFLQENGYQIIEQNFYCRTGEIDLIAKDGNYLVFIEVKYRTNRKNGLPEEAVDKIKQRQIIKTAVYYMMKKGCAGDTPCRFDVVAILGTAVTVYKNAFDAFSL